ncbi:transcription factor 7-like 1-B [Archocentrus centrarchus]|uniref:transcription factor 7-like 1-B n=1 Tax=Archocentrus centrarchus TaxID=63155 RepID=UPI0011EA4A6B|nr:transcription factor 7-like 1-B [Archocentrus centrarchus]
MDRAMVNCTAEDATFNLLGQTPTLFQWPVNCVPTVAAAAPIIHPAAPSNLYNNVLNLPNYVVEYLRPMGELNGVLVSDFASFAPPLRTPAPKKRKRDGHQDEDRPYVKKPPNAFMLFLREQRENVKAELKINGSAAVNAAVAERWKSLSKDQQDKYYEQANEEKMLHSQQHPGWSTKDNYGKKRMRIRGAPCSRASAPKPAQEPEQAKWPSVNMPAYGTFHLPQVNHVLPTAHTNPPASTSYSPYVYPCIGPATPVDSPPSTVVPTEPIATFTGDTAEDLLSALEHLDPLLPAPLPQEPVFLHSDPGSGPATPVDSPPSTVAPTEPMATFVGDTAEDLLSAFDHLDAFLLAPLPEEPVFLHSDPCLGPAPPVDSPTSTLLASPVLTIKPMSAFFCDPEEDLLALLK